MRKQLVGQETQSASKVLDEKWLDLNELAHVDLTSEDPAYPIENALAAGNSSDGWRASALGPQTIRIHFDKPQAVHRLHLRFVEPEQERAQEFLLSYVRNGGQKREIVRQQWTFSPGGSTEQVENYLVNLADIVSVELVIDPDRGLNRMPATLAELRIA
jgi:hypothetical protein